MEEILEIASKLGAAIANHNRYKMFKEAEEQLKKDDEAKEISEELEKQSRKIHELEKNLEPVEVEDKKKLQQLKEKVASNQSIQKFLKVQTDYVELMTKVNKRIDAELAPAND
ncbi:MAG: YlbF family regulator [Planctomycetota bacterium]|jgi:cell fate (sporulation/competence/biofilm development) regulator YlbF (YheA/YmcA/DUF963 family)